MTSAEAFQKWLDELMSGSEKTRRQWIEEVGYHLSTLEWAFSAGFSEGRWGEK